MNVFSPFISFLCHSDRLFHEESCPRLDVVHPGREWPTSPACTWHCSLHYLFHAHVSSDKSTRRRTLYIAVKYFLFKQCLKLVKDEWYTMLTYLQNSTNRWCVWATTSSKSSVVKFNIFNPSLLLLLLARDDGVRASNTATTRADTLRLRVYR